MRTHLVTITTTCLLLSSTFAWSSYEATTPRKTLAPGEVAITAPGNYDKPGTTYVLMNDISSPTSPLFLGKDVTLDLNGYTITYAAGPYEHVPNHGFEDGLKGWDIVKAPGAKVEDMTMTHPLVGKKVCILPEGREIVSPYITLPVANRSYYAMVAVANHRMLVGVFVEDADGKDVRCEFRFADNVRQTCPEPRRASKLGGGVVFALLHGLPAGKYRIRVKAVERDCIIDEVDIRPAMDVGISIVGKTMPWAYYKCILDGDGCAFFDYTKKGSSSRPVDTIPQVKGEGAITIRNGVIRSGFKGIRSWGVLSTAGKVKVILENLKFQAAGINTNAVNVPFGIMRNCRIELDTPWIIDRHRRGAVGVNFSSNAGTSEVVDSEFIGGQGCLALRGRGGVVGGNLFVNDQSVTNHYSLSLDADGAKVYDNRFLPKRGAGIYIYRHRNNEIFRNTFEITASPPINEYSNTDYSVSAVRISDYNASKGASRGWCEGNRVYHNKIRIVGREYPKANPKYKPMAYGFFISVGGGVNYIHDNDIMVEHKQPGSRTAGAYAFYIGGSNQGGNIHRNKITTNVTPIWISNPYGLGRNVLVHDNTFIKARGAGKVIPFKLGHYKHPARNVGLYSNKFVGMEPEVTIGDYTTKYVSEYTFGWTLTVLTPPGAKVTIVNPAGAEVFAATANAKGELTAQLPQFTAVGKKRTDCSSYVVRSGDKEKTVKMTADQTVTLR